MKTSPHSFPLLYSIIISEGLDTLYYVYPPDTGCGGEQTYPLSTDGELRKRGINGWDFRKCWFCLLPQLRAFSGAA